jgi:hypothetical protein
MTVGGVFSARAPADSIPFSSWDNSGARPASGTGAHLRSAIMSDRGAFLVAFLTLVLVIASAFALPELFIHELLIAAIFVVIAVMIFFGDDKFPYMLGMIAPVLWVIVSLLTGRLFSDFGAMFDFLKGQPSGPGGTPLHGFAILAALALVVVSYRAWGKQVTEKFFARTFSIAMVIGLIWVAILFAWDVHMFSTGAAH